MESEPIPVVQFNAGRMFMNNESRQVVADTRKGTVRVVRSHVRGTPIHLVYFQWLSRAVPGSPPEQDAVVVPDEAVFEKVVQSPHRVYILRFKHDDRKWFYWMQGLRPEDDAQLCAAVNREINRPWRVLARPAIVGAPEHWPQAPPQAPPALRLPEAAAAPSVVDGLAGRLAGIRAAAGEEEDVFEGWNFAGLPEGMDTPFQIAATLLLSSPRFQQRIERILAAVPGAGHRGPSRLPLERSRIPDEEMDDPSSPSSQEEDEGEDL